MSEPIFKYKVFGRPIVDWDNFGGREGRLFAKIKTCEKTVEATVASLTKQFENLDEIGARGMKKNNSFLLQIWKTSIEKCVLDFW